MHRLATVAMLAGVFAAGSFADGVVTLAPFFAQGNRVFEIRTYTALEGKLSDLHARECPEFCV